MLSIIIVSYNTRDDLARCLQSLHVTPPSAPHEIIVVDNGSTDRSLDVVKSWPDVRVIEAGSNRGFAVANNLGVRASVGDRLLLLNSDTVVPPGAIDTLLAALERTGAAIAGPRLVDGAGRAELSFGRMPSLISEWFQRRLVRGNQAGNPSAVQNVEQLTQREGWPDWVTGACLLVRRADAEAAGLLDERYFMYLEDVDFCAAIRRRGGRVLFTPEAEVVHLRGRSAAGAPAATRAAYRRSHIAFYEKHRPLTAPLLRLYHWLEARLTGARA